MQAAIIVKDEERQKGKDTLILRQVQKKGSTVETADLNDCLPYENLEKFAFLMKGVLNTFRIKRVSLLTIVGCMISLYDTNVMRRKSCS